MNLEELGFDSWFQRHREEMKRPDCSVARVTRVDRDRYLVRNEIKEVQAEPTGKLLFAADSGEELPCTGDWVFVQYFNDNTLAIIHDLLPRKSFLRRKSAGKVIDYQMIAANIDCACIIQACDFDFNLRRMERYLVMVNEGRVEPIILLSKSDLISAGDLKKRFSEIKEAGINARIVSFSNTTSEGLEQVKEILQKGKTYCLLGSSGVGKTTLLNHLLGQDVFETNPVREKDGRGKHTTASRQLTVLESGALLIDTPGLRELGMMAVGENIDDSFSDIQKLSAECKFNDCTHTVETGCVVLAAVRNGELNEEHYKSYLKLMKESEFHQMSYVERRQKDKKFGRMVRKIMKEKKKR